MRHIYSIIFLVFICSCSCAQSNDNNCVYFNIATNDSVCLDVTTNLDTGKVVQLLSNEKKSVLLIFDGLAHSGKQLLTPNNLKSKLIRAKLEKFKIIRFYVDDRAKNDPNDKLTIGEKNMLFQRHHFKSASQPYYVIIKKGKQVCNSGYLPDDKAILGFFKTCEID